VETHVKDEISIENDFKKYGFAASSSGAEKSISLTHGGEVVAIRNHLNSRPVAYEVLEIIREYYVSELRFAARIMVCKQIEILVLQLIFG
jgi:hypothetical protein